jgi:glycosyltransferase involved in cell wall biosynthesis
MKQSTPQISIGLPVFNGEKYLVEALDSFLGQTFGDFEIIISNNASTDHTEEICKRYAALDARIQYFRNEVNLGGARNHNIVFERSRGIYFKWAGHDDLYAPDYLMTCVNILSSESDIVLCYPKTILIDEFGQEIEKYEDDFELLSPYPYERFNTILHHPMHMLLNPSYGLTRSTNMAKTNGYGNYYSADRVILAELALQGRFKKIPAYLYYRRIHAGSSNDANPSDEGKAIWIDPANKGKVAPPRWRRFLGNLNGVRRASLKPRERYMCYKNLLLFYINPNRFDGIRRDFKQLLAIKPNQVKH